MSADVVVGGFFGDEGKGKIVAYLAIHDKPDIVVRGGVGPNAGHTVVWKGRKYIMSQLPSGFVYENARLLIGPGVLLYPPRLFYEIIEYEINPKRVGIDKHTGIIEDIHRQIDRQTGKKIGTTGTGCGPANAYRAWRKLKLAKDIPELKPFITDVPEELWNTIDNGGHVLVEGTQGTFLSLWHGTYPYVTSKDTTASQILADVGLGPKHVRDVIVVFKAYTTRVGAGPLEGEVPIERFSEVVPYGKPEDERGAVTGRQRRIAPFNFKLAKRACKLNSATMIALTRVDLVFGCRGVKDYDKLPDEAQEFIRKVEKATGVKVKLISTGPEVDEIIDLR